MADRILVFIPCYNCAPQIGRVLAQVRGPLAGFVDEVLVLDNGSNDGTVEQAVVHAPTAEAARVVVARNGENYNLGGSHKAAFAYAERNGFSHVVTLHGDDQGDLSDLLPVLTSGLHRRSDACMGARFTRGARLQNYSTVRIVGNRVFNLIFSLAGRQWITDLGSGLNLVSRAVFADARVRRLPDDLYFNPYLLLDMIDAGRSVRFFPISWREDDQVSNVKMASQALQTLRAPMLYAFQRGKFRREDYRRTPHEHYEFDIIAEFAGREPVSGVAAAHLLRAS